MSDFNHRILEVTAHRPWPMPERPWLMTQTWHDLLFAHWPVDKSKLRPLVPPGFELDLFENEAWVGVVPFQMTNLAPRLVPPMPWMSTFPELNVRTYIRVGDKPGVYFFSLDAGNPLAVGAARTLLNLPYFSAAMKVAVGGDGEVHYESRRASAGSTGLRAEFVARYRGLGDRRPPPRGTLEHFLTERYCLYAVDYAFHAYRLDIHHPPWPLETGDGEITVNTMTEAAGIHLPDLAPLFHFAKRLDMVCWAPERI